MIAYQENEINHDRYASVASGAVLYLKKIEAVFKSGDTLVNVLRDVNLSIDIGESVSLVGQSGAGKTTLLQIAGLLSTPTAGDVYIHGQDTKKLTDDEKTKIRRETIGFVYQTPNLLPEFTSLENVMLPQLVVKKTKKLAEQRAKKLLCEVGLGHRLQHFPKKLSGGEQQRVAIARALANNPSIIIADEPTGNLDPITAGEIFDLFLSLVESNKTSVLMATHNTRLARKLNMVIELINGKI